MAPMPDPTLATAASRSESSVWPRRQATNTATMVATTSATWFGPQSPLVAEQIEGNPDQYDEARDRDERFGKCERLRCFRGGHMCSPFSVLTKTFYHHEAHEEHKVRKF